MNTQGFAYFTARTMAGAMTACLCRQCNAYYSHRWELMHR